MTATCLHVRINTICLYKHICVKQSSTRNFACMYSFIHIHLNILWLIKYTTVHILNTGVTFKAWCSLGRTFQTAAIYISLASRRVAWPSSSAYLAYHIGDDAGLGPAAGSLGVETVWGARRGELPELWHQACGAGLRRGQAHRTLDRREQKA